jgi:hypothetical protein
MLVLYQGDLRGGVLMDDQEVSVKGSVPKD